MAVATIVFVELKVAHVISVVLIVGVVIEVLATKVSTSPETADNQFPVIIPASTSRPTATTESIDIAFIKSPDPNTLGLFVSVGNT